MLVSRQVIAENLGHLPKEVLRKVVLENVIKLYGLKIDGINNRSAARRSDKTKAP
jgi:hypothetical protein